MPASGDGDYVTAPVTLSTPGYYTYRESIAETRHGRGGADRVRGHRRDDDRPRRAGDHDPDQRPVDRAGRADHRHRGGQRAGQARRDGQRRAVGPLPDARRDHLPGHAVLDRHARGHRRRHVHHRAGHAAAAGYYTYRESIAATEAFDAVQTACAEVAETTLAAAAPQVTQVSSHAVVRPGSQIVGHAEGQRAGQDAGDRRRRALRPVRVARRHRLRRHAVLEGQGGRHRRRHVHHGPRPRPARRLLRLPRADRGH